MLDDLHANGRELGDLAALAALAAEFALAFAEKRRTGGAAHPGFEPVLDDAVRVVALAERLPGMPLLRPDFSRKLLGLGGGLKLPRSEEGGRLLLRLWRSRSLPPRLQLLDPLQKHPDQVGDGLGIALGQGDELFAGR